MDKILAPESMTKVNLALWSNKLLNEAMNFKPHEILDFEDVEDIIYTYQDVEYVYKAVLELYKTDLEEEANKLVRRITKSAKLSVLYGRIFYYIFQHNNDFELEHKLIYG